MSKKTHVKNTHDNKVKKFYDNLQLTVGDCSKFKKYSERLDEMNFELTKKSLRPIGTTEKEKTNVRDTPLVDPFLRTTVTTQQTFADAKTPASFELVTKSLNQNVRNLINPEKHNGNSVLKQETNGKTEGEENASHVGDMKKEIAKMREEAKSKLLEMVKGLIQELNNAELNKMQVRFMASNARAYWGLMYEFANKLCTILENNNKENIMGLGVALIMGMRYLYTKKKPEWCKRISKSYTIAAGREFDRLLRRLKRVATRSRRIINRQDKTISKLQSKISDVELGSSPQEKSVKQKLDKWTVVLSVVLLCLNNCISIEKQIEKAESKTKNNLSYSGTAPAKKETSGERTKRGRASNARAKTSASLKKGEKKRRTKSK